MFKIVMKYLAFLGLAAIGVGGWLYFVNSDIRVFGAIAVDGQQSIDWTQAGIGYGATILGVILGAIYRMLRGQDKINDFRAISSDVVRSTDVWAGFCASPIIFGLVLKVTTGVELSGLVVIALENGFCCHVIIDRLIRGQANPAQNA